MHFSLFQNQDTNHVMDLFQKVFKRKISEEFWKWRYGVFGKPIAGLLWDEKKLVGHYMLSPIPMKIDEHIENALLAMSVMIDPDYQEKGIYFGPLAKYTYDNAVKEKYNLIFAFPNEKSYKIHFGPLGWNDFGRIKEYKKHITTKNRLQEFLEYKVESLKIFGNEIDEIWNKHKNEQHIIIPRTSDFLNWRFLAHPKFPYENYYSYDYFPFIIKKNMEPVAYFVIKKFGQEKCHVVDYFGLLNKEVINNILFTGESICIKNEINLLSFWENSEKNRMDFQTIAIQNGYLEDKSHCFFGCKQLNTPNSLYEQKQNWFVTMADSDIF